MNLQTLFEKYSGVAGQLSGEEMQVWRPDYTRKDQTGKLTAVAKWRCAPGGKFNEPNSLSGATLYNLVGRRGLVRAGDVLITKDRNSSTPVLTVDNVQDMKAISAFMTDRVGKITEDVGTDVYTTFRFCWMPIVFPGSSLTESMAGSLGVSTRKFACFKRSGIKREMRLIEEGSEDNQRWLITDFVTQNNVMIVNVKLDTQ